jgi:broad specificity phosphatase PhoE
MAKGVELRRHTEADGDVLTSNGVRAAVDIGSRLDGDYDLLVSSGAQRATQTLACFLAGLGRRFDHGVTVDPIFRSEMEERWFEAAKRGGGGGLESFRAVDPALVDEEARRFGDGLRQVFESLSESGRALIVGHSPMHEVAVYGLTGKIVPPIAKGAGVLVVALEEGFSVELLSTS